MCEHPLAIRPVAMAGRASTAGIRGRGRGRALRERPLAGRALRERPLAQSLRPAEVEGMGREELRAQGPE